jgi:hypothetical protein
VGTGGPFSGVKRRRGLTLTTHLHLVPRSIMNRSYTSSLALFQHKEKFYSVSFDGSYAWLVSLLVPISYFQFFSSSPLLNASNSLKHTLFEKLGWLVGQEIAHLLYHPKVHYRLHDIPSLVPVQGQINPVHNFISSFVTSILVITPYLRLGLLKWSEVPTCRPPNGPQNSVSAKTKQRIHTPILYILYTLFNDAFSVT